MPPDEPNYYKKIKLSKTVLFSEQEGDSGFK
jgi:hypothetical protein